MGALYESGVDQGGTTRGRAPLLSVAIPVHDEVEQLSRVLAGLTAQRGGTDDFEVILVDNNSEDPRLEEVWRAHRERLALTLLRQPRLEHPMALCRARNSALAIARGTWFWTLDSDSIPAPGFLEVLRRRLASAGGERPMLTGERVYIAAEGVPEEEIAAGGDALASVPTILSASNYERPRDRRFPEIERLPDLPQPWDYMLGGNTVYRREDALAVDGYDEGFDGHWGYEDDEFAYRMISVRGCVPEYVEGLVVYHQDPSSPPGWRRHAKEENPNWHRACRLIPGYREEKLKRYAEHGIVVNA